MIKKPELDTIPEYYTYYLNLVQEEDLIQALLDSMEKGLELFETIPPQKESYRYAPEKWTIKQVIRHVLDTERILGYRALRFARKDATPLSGFDENKYAPEDGSDRASVYSIGLEWEWLRKSHIALFHSLEADQLDFRGEANQVGVSPRAIGFFMVGHQLHHFQVIREKYLKI